MSATTFERDSSAARGYARRWRKARAAFLRKNPLCVMCRAEGKTREAHVVDHIIPHKGDRKLFWDRSNWQGLCTAHHSGAKQALERRGYGRQVGADGWPLDPNHPANRGVSS